MIRYFYTLDTFDNSDTLDTCDTFEWYRTAAISIIDACEKISSTLTCIIPLKYNTTSTKIGILAQALFTGYRNIG